MVCDGRFWDKMWVGKQDGVMDLHDYLCQSDSQQVVSMISLGRLEPAGE